MGQVPHQQASFMAPAGSILALYTDGLDLDKIADRVIAGLLGGTGDQAGGFTDDVTLLLVRLPDAPIAAGTSPSLAWPT